MSLGLWAVPFVLVGLIAILWVASKLESLVELSAFEPERPAIDASAPRFNDSAA